MTQFENYVFSKSPWVEDHKCPSLEIKSNSGSLLHRWFYWEPQPDSFLQEFCGSSVIHGLKYISRKKLTMLERIFWIGAFIASLCISGYMINKIYERYHASPVIVTFNPMEQETSKLPFPAVTICNKGLFSAEKLKKLFRQHSEAVDKRPTMEKLRLLHSLCSSKNSFLRRMGLMKPESLPLDWEEVRKHPHQRTLDGAVKFFYDYTPSCSEFIRFCTWDSKPFRNCNLLFKSIVTDYGKCCVFNKIPSELMAFEQDEVHIPAKREQGWSYEDIKEWEKWNYIEGFTVDEDSMIFPYRQRRAGAFYGLSMVVDPDVDNVYCQSQDSLGIRLLLHTPADMPRITHLGTGLGLGKEIFMKVSPDSTIATKEIADFSYHQRKCIFGAASTIDNNPTMTIDKPYTRNNCFLTCQQRHIRLNCNCTLYYVRRRRGWRVCNPTLFSEDDQCVKKIERLLASNLKKDCSNCVYGCNYLKYNMESTEATLFSPEELWGDNETNRPPPWANKKHSIIHIYMGSDVNVPKLRQRLYSVVDLFASIGGLLNLTLGFSVLAAVEVIYLLSLRVCCKRFRKWKLNESPPPSTQKFEFVK